MPRNRFITPGTTKIPLADGDDWIEVKTELDAGDQRKQDTLALVPTLIDGKVVDRIDWSRYELLRAALWITDWSFTKEVKGKVISVPVNLETITSLDAETFEEVSDLIFKHIMAGIEEKKRRKNQKNSQQLELKEDLIST